MYLGDEGTNIAIASSINRHCSRCPSLGADVKCCWSQRRATTDEERGGPNLNIHLQGEVKYSRIYERPKSLASGSDDGLQW